jgi:alpha-tubulin suppressor-like RCC1 family protein
MNNYINTFFAVILLLMVSPTAYKAQGYCTSGCNDNTFTNTTDANTVEYDNLISAFHASIAKGKDGNFKIWGQNSASSGAGDLGKPTLIVPGDARVHFNYTGTPLKAAAGSQNSYHQFALLTTDGLYTWGVNNILISDLITDVVTQDFRKIAIDGKADGLPAGVAPTDVKMMFGSYLTLAIVTCSGEAWVLSSTGAKNGDNTTQNNVDNKIWHRVKTDDVGHPNLENVVAMRGTSNALFALTSTGKLYTWGTLTYNNSGTATIRVYATEVSVPSGAVPRMIGMTQNGTGQSYYLLATDGKLYCMGDNSNKQLGDGTNVAKTVWVQPQKMVDQYGQGTGPLENIVWISPNEHSYQADIAAINVITSNNKQWGWGSNKGFMLGAANPNSFYNLIYMPGLGDPMDVTVTDDLDLTDEVIAVETGGHSTMNIKKCSQSFGYVGHITNGSMGNNNFNDEIYVDYNYSTDVLIVCGTDLGPKIQNLKICTYQTANLNNSIQEAIPSDVEWHATNDANSPVLSNISAVAPGTYYAFFSVASGKCRTVGSIVTVSHYVPDNQSVDPCICFNDAVTGGADHDTKLGITLLKRAGKTDSNWPMARKSGHIALESNTKGFVVTRLTTAQLDVIKNAGNAVEGMMSYDTTVNCMKIYSDGDWKCFNTPSCP